MEKFLNFFGNLFFFFEGFLSFLASWDYAAVLTYFGKLIFLFNYYCMTSRD